MFAHHRARKRLALPVAAVIAAVVGATLTIGAPAQAASADATSGSLSWGVDAGYRAIFSTRAQTAPAEFVNDIATYPLASGSYDDAAKTGTVTFSGATRIGYMTGATPGTADGNYFFLSNPTVTIDGDTATISGTTAGSSHNTNPDLPTAAQAVRTVATVDLSAATETSTSDSISWSAAPTAITAEGAAVLAHYDSASDSAPTKRVTGSALDPVTITIDRALVADPGTTDPGTTNPGTTNPGTTDPGTTDPGTTDPGTTEPATQVTTTTALAVTPAAPVALGADTTLTATVTASDSSSATGRVSFYDTPATTGTRVLLGTAAVADGKAIFTKALAAGGHGFDAAFAGDLDTASNTRYGDSAGSISTTSNGTTTLTNYGVVDATTSSSCSPSGATTTVDGVSASWAWSGYSTGWTKVASGNIALDEQDAQVFDLTDGTATASADCVSIAFTGTMRTEAYAGFFPTHGQWVELVDPTLTIGSDGTGTWAAGVRTGAGDLNENTPVRTVVATISGASFPDVSEDGSESVALDYAGTTAKGTWSAAYSDAWSNAFILQIPSSIRAFYYKSGTTAANDTKPPSAIQLAWNGAELPVDPGTDPTDPTDPTPPGTDPGDVDTADGNLAWGFKASWRSYLANVASGTAATSGGATIADDGRYVFPQATSGTDYDSATGIGTIQYSGAVLFTSAAHGFSIGFQNPAIVFGEDGSVVLTAATSTSDTAGLGSTSRITLVVLDTGTGARSSARASLLAADTGTNVWSDVAATFASTLQPDGWAQYAGTAADPVSFGIGAAAVDPGDGTDTGGSAGSGDTVPGTTVSPADTGDATEAAAVCTAQSVSGATLSWGVKSSFRSYVTGSIANGSISTTGGTTAGSAYGWSGGSGAINASDTLGRVSWSGGVVFDGHAGKLHLTITNPTIRLNGTSTATLYADVYSKALSGSDVNLTQAAIATLSLSSGTSATTGSAIAYSGVPATLTATGATAFGGFYDAGTALDAASFSLPLGQAADCDSSTDPSLAFTGSNGVEGLLAGAAGLVLAGLVLTVVRRRRLRA